MLIHIVRKVIYKFYYLDWTIPIITGNETWINMQNSLQETLDFLILNKNIDFLNFEYAVGLSIFKIDLKNMKQITIKTSNPNGINVINILK
jgi:hypothetical protein